MGDLANKNKAGSTRLLPDLNQKERGFKLESLKKFNINNAFSPPPSYKKSGVEVDTENPNSIKNKGFQHLQTLTLDNRRSDNFGLSMISPNSYSASTLQTFVGGSPLRTKLNPNNLKEISEHQSVSSSREVSLDQIDESKEGVPKGYLTLRKSFKENKMSEEKIGHTKSTFKRKKNRSSLKGIRTTLLNNF
mmetsp:Transcript_10507/g.11983  ORF Transcript_10507/g.11983 Transcript_10507/m.11983 type:complete len:191 (+) Transcript_10507:846-1418(+)